MSSSTAFKTALLQHILQNAALANVGDASGLQPSATAGVLYIGLHTASPGAGGAQNTNEVAYTSYARVSVARSGAGWDVTGAVGSNVGDVTFPEATGGTATATHFSIGSASSGAGNLFLYGALETPLAISTGHEPYFDAGELTVTVED